MPDYLDILASAAMESIDEGYYESTLEINNPPLSLKEAILRCKKAPIISEIKFSSPSLGTLRKNGHVIEIARDMAEGGAVGISILTESKHFKGNIKYMAEARSQLHIPILMKDIVLSPIQIDAASKIGGNAVLLIQAIFDRGYCEDNVQSMIDHSHSRGLEVLLETHTEDEFSSALKTNADMIGINNRNLKTLEVNLAVTKDILKKYSVKDKVIVSESGINSPDDIRSLRDCDVKAFLVGTAIMKSKNIKDKVSELVKAL